MTGYLIANLTEMLITSGEEKVKAILSDFSCPHNYDVEDFLIHSAIEFAKQGISATHLVFASYKDSLVLVGYFTLANKFFTISRTSKMSKTLRRKISKFCNFNAEMQRHELSAPLIAQLGKNYTNGYNKLITGDALLQIACDKIASIQLSMGGKIAYLECEPKPFLLDFYSRHGFIEFDKRPLDSDEQKIMEGGHLVQMIKYFRAPVK